MRTDSVISTDERLTYMASEYYATGEGTTVCLRIAVDLRGRDELKRNFIERFPYYGVTVEFYDREEFFNWYNDYIPVAVKRVINEDEFGHIEWTSMFHVNYS